MRQAPPGQRADRSIYHQRLAVLIQVLCLKGAHGFIGFWPELTVNFNGETSIA
jgi:hypothetical protein